MELSKMLEKAGHKLPDTLSLIAVRTATRMPNAFDDWLVATRRIVPGDIPIGHVVANRRASVRWPCTTDPGTYWLRQPQRAEGTAALAPCCPNEPYLFKLGTHKGQYPCLVQAGPVRVYRDNNRNEVLDLDPASIREGDTWSIQIHRAHPRHKSTVVNKWSAGCVVVPDPNDYDELMALVIDSGLLEVPLFVLEA